MLYLATYLAGVIWCLAVMRDPWAPRLVTALVWPLGPAAFVVVVTVMMLAAVVLWPVPLLGAAALIAALAWLLAG